MYKDRRDVEKYAHLATFEEIKENDYNLNIPRYVDTFEEAPVDMAAVGKEIAEIRRRKRNWKRAYLKRSLHYNMKLMMRYRC